MTGPASSERAGEIALVVGLFFALLAMTTAMGQVERGSNRIYGIERDRPALWKYGRAAIMTAVLALPVGIGFLLLVAGGCVRRRDGRRLRLERRRRPRVEHRPLAGRRVAAGAHHRGDLRPRSAAQAAGLSWLALGSAVAVVLTLFSTGLLAAYVNASPSFGNIYGPLAGVFALLLWSLLSAIALFYGTAVCAQLEAVRSGHPEPAYDDPGRPHREEVSG